jgi:hypothetical protein
MLSIVTLWSFMLFAAMYSPECHFLHKTNVAAPAPSRRWPPVQCSQAQWAGPRSRSFPGRHWGSQAFKRGD